MGKERGALPLGCNMKPIAFGGLRILAVENDGNPLFHQAEIQPEVFDRHAALARIAAQTCRHEIVSRIDSAASPRDHVIVTFGLVATVETWLLPRFLKSYHLSPSLIAMPRAFATASESPVAIASACSTVRCKSP